MRHARRLGFGVAVVRAVTKPLGVRERVGTISDILVWVRVLLIGSRATLMRGRTDSLLVYRAIRFLNIRCLCCHKNVSFVALRYPLACARKPNPMRE